MAKRAWLSMGLRLGVALGGRVDTNPDRRRGNFLGGAPAAAAAVAACLANPMCAIALAIDLAGAAIVGVIVADIVADQIEKGKTVPISPDAHETEIQPGKCDRTGKPLTEDDAVDVVRKGGDVIAKDKEMARRIAERAGNGIPPIFHERHNPGEKAHYHPRNPDGTKGDGHVLF